MTLICNPLYILTKDNTNDFNNIKKYEENICKCNSEKI